MTTKNWGLLREVREYIAAHPEDWNQREWRCESGMCFAGHAAFMSGATWFSQNASDRDHYRSYVVSQAIDGDHAMQAWDSENEVDLPIMVTSAQRRAQVVLGLTLDEAYELFDADNKIETIDATLVAWSFEQPWDEAYAENAARARESVSV